MAEMFSYATVNPGDGRSGNDNGFADTVFMDDAILIERYMTEFQRTGYLNDNDISTKGSLSIHINANRDGNGLKADSWIDFDTQWQVGARRGGGGGGLPSRTARGTRRLPEGLTPHGDAGQRVAPRRGDVAPIGREHPPVLRRCGADPVLALGPGQGLRPQPAKRRRAANHLPRHQARWRRLARAGPQAGLRGRVLLAQPGVRGQALAGASQSSLFSRAPTNLRQQQQPCPTFEERS